MPASMISAPVGSSPKVIGSSMAMVAIGPTPGSTPISSADEAAQEGEAEVLQGQGDAEAEAQVGEEITHQILPL